MDEIETNISDSDLNSTNGVVQYYSNVSSTIINYVYCIIFVVGVVGNIWVFVIIGRNRLTKAVTNIFIVNLAIADLFLMLFLPIIVANRFIGEWVFGMFMCKLYFTSDGVNKFASIMFLVLLSIDRYLAVCHPVASRSIRTVRVAFGMVAASWLLVIALMTPVFLYATILLNIDSENRTSIQCAIYWSHDFEVWERSRKIFTFYTFSISYLIPLLMIWSFYLLILNRLRRQDKLFNYGSSKNSANCRSTTMLRRRRSGRRISIMVLTIVIAYTLCWLPYWLVQVGVELFPEFTNSLGESFTTFSLVAYGFQFMNSAINPFLYAFGTGSYRQECLRTARGNASTNTLNNTGPTSTNHGRDSLSSFTTSFRLMSYIRRESNRSSTTVCKEREGRLSNQPLLDPYYVHTKSITTGSETRRSR